MSAQTYEKAIPNRLGPPAARWLGAAKSQITKDPVGGLHPSDVAHFASPLPHFACNPHHEIATHSAAYEICCSTG